ncbi:hypothetical protein AO715_14775 [Xanthomonas sp. Mitacek01]|nr:hypothetical protein AO715_14775 [Xanthomonas sp. Mitacek01]
MAAQARAILDANGDEAADVERAGVLIDQALSRDPDSPTALVEQARYLMRTGHDGRDYGAGVLDAADAALVRAIARDPGFDRAHVVHGFVLMRQGRLDAARAALERADALDSDDRWLALNWGRLLTMTGDDDAAALRFRGAIEAHPDDAPLVGSIFAELISREWAAEEPDQARIDTLHRRRMAVADDVDAYGNYAGHRLCVHGDTEDAIHYGRQALARADYAGARMAVASAYFVDWARAVAKDRPQPAGEAYSAAVQVLPISPDRLLDITCKGRPLLEEVMQAMHVTGLGAPTTALEAISLAADAAESAESDWQEYVPGFFLMRVRASARVGTDVFLNSELDYKDPRNLSIRLRPDTFAALDARYGAPFENGLKDQVILVRGRARKVRIDLRMGGQPTGQFYFQTHVVVDDAGRVETLDERMKRLPDAPAAPVGTRA